MPIYLEISRLHNCATIVARGKIAPDEIVGAAQKILEANIPGFAKIVDVTMATAIVDMEQIKRIAMLLRGGSDVKRGPVAFLVEPGRGEFARAFAGTQEDRPVHLFKSLRQAREWLQKLADDERRQVPGAVADSSPWADPTREAVMFRRGERREVPVDRPLLAAE